MEEGLEASAEVLEDLVQVLEVFELGVREFGEVGFLEICLLVSDF
jgi:hypothetical protein